MRASPAVLASSLGRGFLEALGVTVALSIMLFGVILASGGALPLWVPVLLLVPILGLIGWLRWRTWSHARFRATTERLLIQNPVALFHGELRTVKWPQYQESHTGHRGPLDLFFRARPICIRYGTADAQNEVSFPSVAYAQDLKHYLDKIDSAFRRNDASALHVFVAKPRGKRDTEPVS